MRKKEKARLLLQQRWDHEHRWDALSDDEVCQILNQWVIDPRVPEGIELPRPWKRFQEDVIYQLRQAVENPKVRPNIEKLYGSKLHPGTVIYFLDKSRVVKEVKILTDREGAVSPGYVEFADGYIRRWNNKQPKFYQVHIVTNKPTPQRPPDLPPKQSRWPKKEKVKVEKPKVPYVKRADRTDPVTGRITSMKRIQRDEWRKQGIQVREPARPSKPIYNPDVVGDLKEFKRKQRELRGIKSKKK